MAVNKEIYEALSLENGVTKNLDAVVTTIKREVKVRFGVELTDKEIVEVIKQIAEERLG